MRLAGLVCAFLLLVVEGAWAEWQIRPFLGATFGTSTTFVDLERAYPEDGAGKRNLTVGVNGAWLGNMLGFEGDLGLAPGFFQRGDQELVLSSRVTTLTGNVVLTLPRRMTRYTLRPYLVGGAGLMRVRIDEFFGTLKVVDTLPAIDIGGGATGFLSDYVGVNWDVRYFRSVGGSSGDGVTFGREQLSFWRATMGVAIRTERTIP